MAGPLMHSVQIDADAEKIYEALSTSKGLASFWTVDSYAEPKVGSTARFGFHGPVLEMRVEELKPAKDGGNEVVFNHEGWPEAVPAADLASVNYSWGRVVGRLKKYAETGKPAPYFP